MQPIRGDAVSDGPAPAESPDDLPEATETSSLEPSVDNSVDEIVDNDVDNQSSSETTAPSRSRRTVDPEQLEREGDIAADYLEGLLDIADLDGDIDMDVENDRALVAIGGADLHELVGKNGEVLEALQELTRLAVYRETGNRSRLMLDISGHREARRARVSDRGRRAIDEARASGQPVHLEAMNPFERKVVHDVVAAAGLVSDSEGEEPHRHVVIHPAAEASAAE
jgi:spoIIIJ-associated protein